MPLGSVEIYLSELLVAAYLREININFYLSLMFICISATMKKSSKKKEMEIEKEMVEVLKYASGRRKKAGK